MAVSELAKPSRVKTRRHSVNGALVQASSGRLATHLEERIRYPVELALAVRPGLATVWDGATAGAGVARAEADATRRMPLPALNWPLSVRAELAACVAAAQITAQGEATPTTPPKIPAPQSDAAPVPRTPTYTVQLVVTTYKRAALSRQPPIELGVGIPG